MTGCGNGTGPREGLAPGTYRLTFEMGATVAIPDPLEGRHEITFRMRDPGAAPGDLELVDSRRILLEGGVEEGYLVLDPVAIEILEDRWRLRFPYAEGEYSVGATLVDLGNGSISISPGCVGRESSGASYLAAGCRLDRI